MSHHVMITAKIDKNGNFKRSFVYFYQFSIFDNILGNSSSTCTIRYCGEQNLKIKSFERGYPNLGITQMC